MVTRRRWLGAAAAGLPSLAALGGPAAARAAWAADPFPARPIRLIVPFAAGGGTDVLARILANDLGARLGQPMVVENRAGAGGNLAMEAVIRAPADGYTLLMGTNGAVAANRHLYRGLPFDPVRDLAPVSLTFRIEHLLVVRPDLPARSVAELIALARARPGQMTFGSAGSGSMIHLAGELFRLRAGVDLTHVPYRGGGPAMNDLVAGTIDMMFDSLPSAEPQVRAGRVRALALCAPRRHALMPDLPTMVEAGVPDYAAHLGRGVRPGGDAAARRRAPRRRNPRGGRGAGVPRADGALGGRRRGLLARRTGEDGAGRERDLGPGGARGEHHPELTTAAALGRSVAHRHARGAHDLRPLGDLGGARCASTNLPGPATSLARAHDLALIIIIIIISSDGTTGITRDCQGVSAGAVPGALAGAARYQGVRDLRHTVRHTAVSGRPAARVSGAFELPASAGRLEDARRRGRRRPLGGAGRNRRRAGRGGLLGHGREWLLGAERHRRPPDGRKPKRSPAPTAAFANSIRPYGADVSGVISAFREIQQAVHEAGQEGGRTTETHLSTAACAGPRTMAARSRRVPDPRARSAPFLGGRWS